MDLLLDSDNKLSSKEISAFEQHNIASYDLLTLEPSELARKTNLSVRTEINQDSVLTTEFCRSRRSLKSHRTYAGIADRDSAGLPSIVTALKGS